MRNQINQDVECTLFRTAFDTLSYTPATLGNYFADVVNGKYKQPVENVRALVASGRQEEANACKKTCLCWWRVVAWRAAANASTWQVTPAA